MTHDPRAKEKVTWGSIRAELRLHYRLLAVLLGLMWLEETVDMVLGGRLDRFGIIPRDPAGLIGIPLAPFLHAGFGHLISNTVPLLVLGWLVLLRETKHFIAVFAAATLVGGLGVWAFGHSGTHIGASGVVFGLLGYLLLTGWFERSIGTIILSVFVGLTYGWALLGLSPLQSHVSWEAHLFGFLAGAVMARLLTAKKAKSSSKPRTARRTA